MSQRREIVSVIGLGYVGLPLSAALANVGFRVIGLDIDEGRIKSLKDGKTPFYEPGLKETLEKNKERIRYTTDPSYAINKSNVIFVTVGTPLDNESNPNYSYLDKCIKDVGNNLKKGKLIILKSTVVVGTTEEYVVPKLEEISGLKAGKDFFVAFCPERTIEGLALHELYNLPKIIGGINRKSSLKARDILKRLGSKVNIVSGPSTAEMCKLVDNLYRATNIAFANELGMVCEKEGIDAKEVASTVNNSYSRTKIFNPGLGADGPCLSKDPLIFKYSASKHKLNLPLTEGCIVQNVYSTSRIADFIEEFVKENNLKEIDLALLGLAFKGSPETDDLRGSPAIKILELLKKKNIKLNSVNLYDPVVENFLDYEVEKTLEKAVKKSNIILFLTNHPKIMGVNLHRILKNKQHPVFIIDAWRNTSNANLPKNVSYFGIGNGKIKKN